MNSPAFSADLQTLFDDLNAQYFDAILPSCEIIWSQRLTRAAGNINVRARVIKMSLPILRDAFQNSPQSETQNATIFPPAYSVCGVLCDSHESATREILKHEMIHLWLFMRGVPHGHTREFRQKAREIGQPKTRHEIASPAPKNGWIYRCVSCAHEFPRRRRYGRAVACARCCKSFANGKFDARFALRGRRIMAQNETHFASQSATKNVRDS